MREAYHIATTGRPGPVLIDIPKDVSQGPFPGDLNAEIDLPGYHPDRRLRDRRRCASRSPRRLINTAKRPVILVGQGAMISGAEPELKQAGRELDCPVTTTLLGKGVVSGDPSALARHAGHARHRLRQQGGGECDLICQLGSRFDDRHHRSGRQVLRAGQDLHIDIDHAEIGKMIRPDIQVVGDAKTALQQLLPHVDKAGPTGNGCNT